MLAVVRHTAPDPLWSRTARRVMRCEQLGQDHPLTWNTRARSNTSDPDTVGDQVRKLAEQFGAKEVVLVGDRGMIKAKGRELLAKEGFRYVTSMTDPEIRKTLAAGTLQLDLFDDEVTEVVGEDRRYVLLRNPAMTKRTRTRRADQLARVREKVDARNAVVVWSNARRDRARAVSDMSGLAALVQEAHITCPVTARQAVYGEHVPSDCSRRGD